MWQFYKSPGLSQRRNPNSEMISPKRIGGKAKKESLWEGGFSMVKKERIRVYFPVPYMRFVVS